MATVKTSLTLHPGAMQRMLRGRDGQVGRVMAGFAGLATAACRDVARERINVRTGEYVRRISSTTRGTTEGVGVVVTAGAAYSAVLEFGSRPHVIVPRRARVLRFETPGGVVYTRRAMHPGTRPYSILRDGVRRAGRQLGRIAAIR